MTEKYLEAVRWVINWETGNGSLMRLTDEDGRTLCGINERAHHDWVVQWWDKPDADVIAAARDLYYTDYWHAAGCDNALPGVDVLAFDAAVNQGVALGRDVATCNTKAAAICLRLERYADAVHRCPERMKFLVGWLRRIIALWRAML
jgi:lysozyme family protein